MKVKSVVAGGAVLLILALTASSSFAAVTIQFNNGTQQVTSGLTAFSTFGDMMDGMSLTAYFLGGGSETVAWATTGAGAGGASGTGWSISESGDTWNSPWTLSAGNTGLSGLFMDAGTGDAVFDTYMTGMGTTGSAQGSDFSVNSGPAGLNILATYRDIVALTSQPPVGDLYRCLDLQFSSATGGGLAAGSTLVFEQDTDNLAISGDIKPDNPIPEPATMLLIGAGLAGLAVRRRRR